ncbi:MAG: IclR family transcriptional regulator [Spirochaetia bacterium]|jgi:DNA-binding IclR family transcriptional regulator
MAVKDSNKSSTTLRAFRLLEIVGHATTPLSVADVSERANLDRTTVYRTLMTLMDAGYLVRDDSSKLYALSYRFVTLAKNLLEEDNDLALVRDTMKEISRLTAETCHYSVLERYETVIIMKSKGTQLVSVDFQIGERGPIHATSIGKALLAFQDARMTEEVIARGLKKYGPNTITEAVAFRAELRKVRSRGYAIDDFEFAEDMRCIACPVYERGGRVRGGISLSGPASRYDDAKLKEMLDILTSRCRELSAKLGGVPWTD